MVLQEVRHSSSLRISSKLKELFFMLLKFLVIELMIEQGPPKESFHLGPPKKFLPGAPQVLSAALAIILYCGINLQLLFWF
jgi:hypothetical protein